MCLVFRAAAINAGAGQRVNPGFFDSRTNLTKAELDLAKAYRNDPANIFANQAYKNTGQTGLRGFISGGGILGALVRGLGQKFGLGKKAGEVTYDMSEFNNLRNVDGEVIDTTGLELDKGMFGFPVNTNVTNQKPTANIKATNLNDLEIGNPGKYATADMINEFGVKAGTADDIGFIGMPGTADDRFANMYEDPFGNPLNDPRVVSEEMGLVGNQVPQGIRFNNPIGGVDQFAKEMEALEANLPMGVNAIMTPEMMGGTLQDFYTNRNLTGASTGGIPSNAKSMFEVFNDNVNFNDQASLPGNNMVAEITQKDIDRFKQPMTQMMDYDTYKSINTDSTLTPDEFNQLKAQV